MVAEEVRKAPIIRRVKQEVGLQNMVSPLKIGTTIEAGDSAVKNGSRKYTLDPRRYAPQEKKKKKKNTQIRLVQGPNHQVMRLIVIAAATNNPYHLLPYQRPPEPVNTAKED
jgi:hypothetical protein